MRRRPLPPPTRRMVLPLEARDRAWADTCCLGFRDRPRRWIEKSLDASGRTPGRIERPSTRPMEPSPITLLLEQQSKRSDTKKEVLSCIVRSGSIQRKLELLTKPLKGQIPTSLEIEYRLAEIWHWEFRANNNSESHVLN